MSGSFVKYHVSFTGIKELLRGRSICSLTNNLSNIGVLREIPLLVRQDLPDHDVIKPGRWR
jgi:hypothetical protein